MPEFGPEVNRPSWMAPALKMTIWRLLQCSVCPQVYATAAPSGVHEQFPISLAIFVIG